MSRMSCAILAVCTLLALEPALPAQQEPNLVFNGDFERGADGWAASGDRRTVKQVLHVALGRKEGRCALLRCTEFEGGAPSRHAMLAQRDRIKVRKGYLYTLTFWAKGQAIEDYVVNVALQDTNGWHKLGLMSSFVPTGKWKRFEFKFVALRDCMRASRLQFWFLSTGSLWIDDVIMTEGERMPGGLPQLPATPLLAEGRTNLVPNASFECGRDGWGSATPQYIFWGSPINRLFGEVVSGNAPHGKHCLRITLNAKTQPLMCFDYLRPLRHKVRAPLAGNLGYIVLERGKTHVLSAYLKADKEDTPAHMGVRYLGSYSPGTTIRVGTAWKRYTWRFRAARPYGFVLVGPDLRESTRTACTLMIDAVQLERADAATRFTPRDPVEVSMATQRPGNIFIDGERPVITIRAQNAAAASRNVTVRISITDYFDKEVLKKDVSFRIAAGRTVERTVDPRITARGYYRVRATLDGKSIRSRLHLAVIPRPRHRTDSVIGINHAYGWDHLVKATVNAGIVWDRDWSFKWEDIERKKGTFDFSEIDFQVNRELRLGHKVLGLVPFPSANWVSSAPASVNPKRERRNRNREAWKPRDDEAFRNFVTRTVRHFRGRITWWQVFNEPLYTSYALPRRNGHTVEDYLRYVKIFHDAAKAADPDCKVLAGPGGFSVGTDSDLDKMLKQGLLKYCDALDLHTYPRWRPPEALERVMVRLNELVDATGTPRPLWLTEHGYYAEDDPFVRPPTLEDFSRTLPTERMQAEYAVRFNLLLLRHGFRKIFYHAGTSTGLNRDSVQGVFYRYDGEPRKIYPVVAAFNELFGPNVQLVKDVSRKGVFRAIIFRDGKRLILAAWQPPGGHDASVRVTNRRVRMRDIVGNPIALGTNPELAENPVVFAVAEDVALKDFVKWAYVTEK